MKTQLIVADPNIVEENGLLQILLSFSISLGKSLAEIKKLHGYTHMRILAVYDDAEQFRKELGFPLRITYYLCHSLGTGDSGRHFACLYAQGEKARLVSHDEPSDARQPIDGSPQEVADKFAAMIKSHYTY